MWGVVIEEDGKTEEEFISGLIELNDKYDVLNQHASNLSKIISHNLKELCGE